MMSTPMMTVTVLLMKAIASRLMHPNMPIVMVMVSVITQTTAQPQATATRRMLMTTVSAMYVSPLMQMILQQHNPL